MNGKNESRPHRKQRMNRVVLILAMRAMVIALFGFTVSPARAQLDAEAKKPYQLQIVLQIGSNRVFTPLFQEQLQRDVQNHLKLAFGDLATIEVTGEHPLLRDINAKGLAVLDVHDSLTERTTHFVLLDYAAGTYQVRTRFHDGPTGLPAPIVQQASTTDRQAVAATIVRLIETSFSPVGTVTAVSANGQEATLKLQGSDLGVAFERWVKPGHVFAVSRIVGEGGRLRAERVDWALLEVASGPTAGTCRCRYWKRYAEDVLTQSPGTLGFRALHLPTVTAPLKLQLLPEGEGKASTEIKPLQDTQVIVTQGRNAKSEKFITKKDGLVATEKPFAHFAVVQVLDGAQVRTQFPVEILPGRTAVARVSVKTDREALSLTVNRDAWVSRVYDNVRISAEREQELSRQLNQSLEAALDAARRSLPLLDEEIKYLDRERDALHRLARDKKQTIDTGEGERQLDELRRQAKDLMAFVERIDDVLKKSAGDERALGLHKLLERAQRFEAEADFESAIRTYAQVVQANPNQTAKVQARLDQLRAAWKTKDAEHDKARAFVYQTWPTLDVAGLDKNLDAAKKAWATCRAAGDKLTAQKFLRVLVVHTATLKKELETLKKRDTEDNRNRAKAVARITDVLRAMHVEALEVVGPRKD